MNDRERDALQRKLNGLHREIAKVQQALNATTEVEPKPLEMSDFGTDVYEVGAVVRYCKKFVGTKEIYTYVAVKFASTGVVWSSNARVWRSTGRPSINFGWYDIADHARERASWLVFEVLVEAKYAVQTYRADREVKTVPAHYWKELVRWEA